MAQNPLVRPGAFAGGVFIPARQGVWDNAAPSVKAPKSPMLSSKPGDMTWDAYQLRQRDARAAMLKVAPMPALRQDGPTLEEYVAAGYAAAGYPPAGYAARLAPAGGPTLPATAPVAALAGAAPAMPAGTPVQDPPGPAEAGAPVPAPAGPAGSPDVKAP